MSPAERLLRVVRKLEQLEEAKAAAAEELAQEYKAARNVGFDPATLKVVLKLRRLSPEQRRERRALEAIYLASLGMLDGDSLPEEARRRLDEPAPSKPSAPPEAPARSDDAPATPAPAPAPPRQETIPLKDPDEARQEGRDAAKAGKRIYDNPYPAGDPCRAAWDEGWCEQKKSHGMDTPSAYQRRKPPDGADKGAGAGGEA